MDAKESQKKKIKRFKDDDKIVQAVCRGPEAISPFLKGNNREKINWLQSNGYTLLQVGVCEGTEDVVKWLLSRGADPNVKNKNGKFALHLACEDGSESMAKILIEHGADVSARDPDGRTALHIAAKEGNGNFAKLLLDHGGMDVINAQNDNKETALLLACERGHEEIVKLLMKHGADITVTDRDDDSVLFKAAKGRNINIVKLFLDNTRDINARNSGNETVLHFASEVGNEEIVKLLIERGAEVNVKHKYGYTPLHIAAEAKRANIAKILLDCGAEVNAKNNHEETALKIAIEVGSEEVVKILVERGANICIDDYSGKTYLHDAVEKRHLHVVELLLNAGFDPNVSLNEGTTALHLAMSRAWDEDIVKLLVERGAEINIEDRLGRTPLEIACIRGHKTIARLLLECGADVGAADNAGMTLLQRFVNSCQFFSGSHIKIIKLLLDYRVNINIYDGSNSSIISLVHDKHRTFAEILVSDIVKMQSENLYVSQDILRDIDGNNELKVFKTKCEKEIDFMKSSGSDRCFYELLTANISALAHFASDQSILQVLISEEFDKRYPIYSSILRSKIQAGVRRNMLLDKVKLFFAALARAEGNESLPILPKVCVDKIFSYFGNKELKNLIKVCDPSGDFDLDRRPGMPPRKSAQFRRVAPWQAQVFQKSVVSFNYELMFAKLGFGFNL